MPTNRYANDLPTYRAHDWGAAYRQQASQQAQLADPPHYAQSVQAQQGFSSLEHIRARIGPLHVVNGHMPLAAGEVAEMRPTLTLRRVAGALVDLGATLGFVAFVVFMLSRVIS